MELVLRKPPSGGGSGSGAPLPEGEFTISGGRNAGGNRR